LELVQVGLTEVIKTLEVETVAELEPGTTVTSVVNSITVEEPYPRGTVWLRVTTETTIVEMLADSEDDDTPSVTVTTIGWPEVEVGGTAPDVLTSYPPELVDMSVLLLASVGELDETVAVRTLLPETLLGPGITPVTVTMAG
jgi:hypothetical protein